MQSPVPHGQSLDKSLESLFTLCYLRYRRFQIVVGPDVNRFNKIHRTAHPFTDPMFLTKLFLVTSVNQVLLFTCLLSTDIDHTIVHYLLVF